MALLKYEHFDLYGAGSSALDASIDIQLLSRALESQFMVTHDGVNTRRGRGFRNHTLRRARPQRRVVAVSYLLERPCRRGATRHRCYADGDCCIRITVCGFMRRGFPRHAADRLQAPMPPRPARETHMRRPCG